MENGVFLHRLYWAGYLAAQLRGQGRYPFRPTEVVRRDQARRVRRMVAHAYRYVPHYREAMQRLGLTPADFRAADDLARLPLVERQDVQRDPERFRSEAIPESRCLVLRTSGSSAMPIKVCLDRPALFQSAAHTGRERAQVTPLVGRRFGYREALILPDVTQTADVLEFCHRQAWFPPSCRVERLRLSVHNPPSENVPRLNEFRPDVIFTYGSYLGMLFAHVKASGVAFHRPKALTYSSDDLPAPARRLILEEFRIPAFAWYRAVEAFNMGQECEQHRGIHLNVDLHPVRIVDADGRPVAVGETGDVVVSNLVNRATVLLNYRLGDTAALLPEPCPCGRSLPLLSFPPGRSDDVIVLPSGRIVHPVVTRCMLIEEQGVWAAQVAQESPSHFEVTAVPREGCDRAALAARLAQRFREKMGEPVTVNVTLVESLQRTASGKHRLVTSKPGRAAAAAAIRVAKEGQ